MKKRIIFVLIAVLAVSFSSTGFASIKSLKAKAGLTKKADKKTASIVLVKGLKLNGCRGEVKDDGSVTIMGLKNVTIPVKKGKFDLALPSTPVFTIEEWELNQLMDGIEMNFGTAKVYPINVIYYQSSSKKAKETDGRCNIRFEVYYSDKDIKGTINGKPVSLKKGWNLVDDKKELDAEQLELQFMCAG